MQSNSMERAQRKRKSACFTPPPPPSPEHAHSVGFSLLQDTVVTPFAYKTTHEHSKTVAAQSDCPICQLHVLNVPQLGMFAFGSVLIPFEMET